MLIAEGSYSIATEIMECFRPSYAIFVVAFVVPALRRSVRFVEGAPRHLRDHEELGDQHSECHGGGFGAVEMDRFHYLGDHAL